MVMEWLGSFGKFENDKSTTKARLTRGAKREFSSALHVLGCLISQRPISNRRIPFVVTLIRPPGIRMKSVGVFCGRQRAANKTATELG